MRKILAYCTGWLLTLAWITFLGSCGVIIGNTIKYCILVYHPDSPAANSQWLPTVLALIVLVGGAFFNIHLAKKFPMIEGIMLVIHLAGWVAVIVTLWTTSPRGNTHDVIFTFTNPGGWPNAGVASLIGVLTPFSSLFGYDSSVHMSTCKNPLSRNSTLTCNSRKRKGRLSHHSPVSDDSLRCQCDNGFHRRNYHDILHWGCGRRPCFAFTFRSSFPELHRKQSWNNHPYRSHHPRLLLGLDQRSRHRKSSAVVVCQRRRSARRPLPRARA